MAKRRTYASGIDKFAEDLGSILGTAQTKAESWLGQRESIAEQLTRIRDEASSLLGKLTGGVTKFAKAVKRGRGRPAGGRTKASPGRPPGHKVSDAARLKMSIAAKRRWAERKAAEKAAEKKVEKSADKKADKRAAK